MDIFMRNIPLSLSSSALKAEVAAKIHHRDYSLHSPDGVPLNFKAVIFPRKGTAATRCGTLTLPTRAAAEQFLREFSGITPSKSIIILGTIIRFSESRRPPRPDILEEIRRSPYTGPEAERRREQLDSQLREKFIAVTCLQFGWECRDDVLSIEWERKCDGKLTYSLDDREFRIKIPGSQRYHIVVIHAAQVRWASAELDQSRNAAIYFSLGHPPSYETEARESPLSLLLDQLQLSTRYLPKRHRWSSLQLDKSHGAVAPYTSLAIRVVCGGPSDLETFRWISRIARLGLETYAFPTVRRGLFCEQVRNEHYDWLRSLHWKVAFQAESLTRELLVDLKEMSTLRGRIEGMVNDKGVSYTAGFLRHLAAQARLWFNDAQSTTGDVVELFVQCEQDYVPPPSRVPQAGSAETFDCLHLTVTPTTIYLSGPFPERSNRIIRQYPDNQDCFLRVNFTDEYKLQFRFDREVDGSAFVRRRVGGMLSNGIHVAGRLFKFLAYSQSALKDHAVWFVTEFITSGGEVINAPAIIAGLGTFHGLEHDPKLINCPARYGARISQAFTTTDPSISVEAEEVFYLDDIKDTEGKWCFTDGVGTISPELARDVWKALRPHRPGNYRRPRCPHAFQLRLMGSKGMVSIDHRLSGRAICLRPSMIKFQAPHSRNIEVARAFDKPSPFYLNRPLIMVLEDLGVPYSTFQDLQDAAVQEAERSTESLGLAARLMERFGLGTSFRLSSVFLSLEKLGVGPLQDVFWKHMMDFAINHVLRDLKHHARIPVPGAWNVVGIADVYGYLEEGQIFVHIAPTNGEPEEYLEGPTLVTRSPIIHPGDVQIAHSIGKPPPGSPFERTSFRNCVVFSTKGTRPLPSCLGGGDLDGDIYCCTTIPSLLPPRTCEAAPYTPAVRRILDRPSTMQDVADFVTEYINSDNLGIIALTWLIIADQSRQGVFDSDCMKLSQLHSDAVDYPKSGIPVDMVKIPRPHQRTKPDWNAPETLPAGIDSDNYYRSTRAIGRLFREISLPALQTVKKALRSQSKGLREGRHVSLEKFTKALEADRGPIPNEDPVRLALQRRVAGFIEIGEHEESLVADIFDIFESYASQLQLICIDHTISPTSRSATAMLTEEEAVIGTIVAKCTQPRMRRDTMSKLREQTDILVQSIIQQLVGQDGNYDESSMERAWIAFRIAGMEGLYFGSKSFAWIALWVAFEAIKKVEESEGRI